MQVGLNLRRQPAGKSEFGIVVPENAINPVQPVAVAVEFMQIGGV